jgi:2-amino-4-hydroxy-6-hydroxymethyldihydropteridine diphosphokinase
MITSYIGLGSNLDHPQQQVLQAFDELDCIPESWLVNTSSLYSSAPMGPEDQPDYVNAVAEIQTRLDAVELLYELQIIENRHGRVRERRWGARTLDLDLLLYGDNVIDQTELTVPHPGIARRAFVLLPLQEVAPQLQIPGTGNIGTLINDSMEDQARRIQ